MSDVPPNHPKRQILLLHPHAVDFDRQVERAVAYGCGEPIRVTPEHIGVYKFGSTPFRVGIPLRPTHTINRSEMRRHLRYLLRSRPDVGCRTQMKIDPDTLLWLARHTFRGNKKQPRQKEQSGRILLRPLSEDRVMAFLSTDHVVQGSSESTPSHTTYGSFHTHPEDAYRRHGVCVAFPSAADYQVSFELYLSHGSCFHLLSAIEGLYLITVKPSFARLEPRRHLHGKRIAERWSKVIERAYDDGYPGCSLDRKKLSQFQEKYVRKYLQCINRKPIFDVQFLSWNEAVAGKSFQWSYPSEKQNCILTDRQHKLVHSL